MTLKVTGRADTIQNCKRFFSYTGTVLIYDYHFQKLQMNNSEFLFL